MQKPTRVVINLPGKLIDDLSPVLIARGLKIEDVCRLYLRSLVTVSKKTAAVELHEEMPIGKYKGEVLETIIRAELGYVAWLLAHVETFKVAPEALELLAEFTGDKD